MRAALQALLCTACLASCQGGGAIYTHVTEPLDVDFDATPVQPLEARGDVKQVRYRFVDVQWDSNAIGEIALAHGIDEVYYADLESFSILGFWTRQTVHIFGRSLDSTEESPTP